MELLNAVIELIKAMIVGAIACFLWLMWVN